MRSESSPITEQVELALFESYYINYGDLYCKERVQLHMDASETELLLFICLETFFANYVTLLKKQFWSNSGPNVPWLYVYQTWQTYRRLL